MNYLVLIPLVFDVVKTVEKLITESGKSAEKLEAARLMLEGLYESVAENWPKIKVLIEVMVGLLHKTGVFKKK